MQPETTVRIKIGKVTQ